MSYIFYDPDIQYSVFPPLFFTLSNMYNKKNAGYPEGGGGYGLAKSMETTYIEQGGEIFYKKKRVKKIIIENNEAKGVELEDGSTYFADIIISAIDGRTTIFDLLDSKYVDDNVDLIYKKNAKVHPSMLRVFIGVDMDFTDKPHAKIYVQDKPLDIPGALGGKETSIFIRHYCHTGPSYAPKGKSVLTSFFSSEL